MLSICINEQSNFITGILPFSSDVGRGFKIASVSKGGKFIDCTFGGGNFSKEILKYSSTFVEAYDRDKQILPKARELEKIS